MDSNAAEIRRLWIRVIVFCAIVAALFLAVRTLPVVPSIERLQGWMNDLGPLAPLMFSGAYVVAAVLLVPDTILKIAAGALFGLLWGVVIASLAATVGAALAFLLARHVARGFISHQTTRYPKFGAVDRAIGKEGWKIVALLRLVPIFPYNLGNYAFGVTSIRFWPYVFGSWLAMLPGAFVLVYLGHVGRITLESAARGEVILEPGNFALLMAGLLFAGGITIYIARVARRAIDEYVREQEDNNDTNNREPAAVPAET